MQQIADIDIDVMDDVEPGDDHDILDSLNISMDSTGMLFIMCMLKYVDNQVKRYPDFVITSYGDDEDDKICLIVENGSLYGQAATEKLIKFVG
jgi:hypothetical protein